ncbi:thiamine diphosphokinase [Paracoccus endophyticus]|uniref:thiamine diphosphokinase n=1 Tax=Paracoccus endophyticus TaxID=2233774 RepID=UPI000DD7C3EB|nr:thiamine diphosphokinase [Paracoccus endophyticus]
MTPVLRATQGVTLIGGGTVAPGDATLALARAPVVMAADGGAAAALALGLMPAAVAGDMDSLPEGAQAAIPPRRVHRIADQVTTDFEKCLARLDAPFVIAIGFAGSRTDHLLATLNVLVRLRVPPCLLLAGGDVIFAVPDRLALDVPAGTRLSLFPLGRVTGTSRGLRWPLDGLVLDPAGQVGTSNQATGPVALALDGPCLVILPRAGLDAAMKGLGLSAP